jgi:hypothetical protein
MIKIERNEKMERAAARCRNIHPKVRRVDAQTVTVYGSKGSRYTVRFAEPKPGLKLAACDCEAGRNSQLCYHVAAAVVAPVVAAQPVKQDSEAEAAVNAPALPTAPPAAKPTIKRAVIEKTYYTCPKTHRRIPATRCDGWDI